MFALGFVISSFQRASVSDPLESQFGESLETLADNLFGSASCNSFELTVLYLVVIGLSTGGEAKGSKVLAEMMFSLQGLRVSANCTFCS